MADYNLNGEPNEEQTKWEGERLADATTAPVLEEQKTAVEPVVETQSQPVETAPVAEAPAQPERTPLTKEDIAKRYGTFTDDEVDAMSEDEYGNLLKEAERRGDYESESTKAQKKLASRLETAEQLARMTDFIIDETEGEEDHKADHDFAVKARDFLRNDTSLFTGLDDRRAQIVANDIMKRHKEASERRGKLSVLWDAAKRSPRNFASLIYNGYMNLTTDMTGENMENVKALHKYNKTEDVASPGSGKSLRNSETLGDYLTIALEGTIDNAPRFLVGAGATAAGAMVGGAAGALVVGSAFTMLQNTGEAVEDQLEEMENDPSVKYSRLLANAQGGAYSVLDGAFGIQAVMGKLWAKGLKAIGMEAVKEGKVKAIEEIAKMATVKGALGEWFKGMVEEGIQEPLQSQVFGRLRRYLQTGSFLRKGESETDAWWETADEAFGGASTAAFIGFLGAGSSHVNANRIQRVYDNIDAALNNDKTYQALDAKTRMLVKQRVANDSYMEVAGLFSEDARARVEELSTAIDKELKTMAGTKGDSKAAQNARMQGASAMAYLDIFKSRFATEDFDSVVNSEEGQAIAANLTPEERRAQHEEMRNSEKRIDSKDGTHILVYTNPVTQVQVAHLVGKDGSDLGWGVTNVMNRKEPLFSSNFASLEEALNHADKISVFNQVREQRQAAKKAVIEKVFREIYGNRSPQLVFVDRPDATVDTRDALPAGAKAEYTASDNTVRINTDAIKNLGQLYTILTHERTHADIAEHVKDQIIKDGLAKSADDVTADQIKAMKEKYFGLDENENEKVKGSKASYEANKGENAWGESVAKTGEELLAERNSIIALRNAVVSTEKNALSALADRIRSAVGMKMASDMRLDARAIMQADVLEEMKYLMDNDYLGKEVEVQPGARTAQLKAPMTLDEQVRQYVAESEGKSEEQATETATQTTTETATQTATETATAEAPQETSGNAPVSAPTETATTAQAEEPKTATPAKPTESAAPKAGAPKAPAPKPSAKPKNVKGTADDIKPIDSSMKRGAKGTGAEIVAEVKRVLTDPRHNAQTLGEAISDAEAILKQKKNALRLTKSQRAEIENLIDDAETRVLRIKDENRENAGERNRARALERRGLKNRKQMREMLRWAVENGAIAPGSYLSYLVGENGSFSGILPSVPAVTWKKDSAGNVKAYWNAGGDIDSVVPASTFMTVTVGKDGEAKYAPSDSLEAWQMGQMLFGMSPKAIVDAATDKETEHGGLDDFVASIKQEMTPEQAEAFEGKDDPTVVLQDTISQYEDAEKAFDRQAKDEEEQARAFVEQQEAEERENREEREAMGADNEERAAAEVKFAEDDAYGYGKLVNDVNHFNSMMMFQADEEQMKEAWDRLDSNGKALAYLHLRTELDPEGFYGLVSDDEIRMFKSAAEDVAMGKAAFDGDQDAFAAIWAALTTRDLGIRSEDIDELNANDDRNTQTGSRDNYAHYGLLEKYISALFGRAYSNPGAVGEVQSRVLMRMMADLNSKGKSNYEAKKAYWSKASPIQIAFKYAKDEKNSYVRQLMGGGGHEKKTDVAILDAKVRNTETDETLLSFKRSGDFAIPVSSYVRTQKQLEKFRKKAIQKLEDLVFPYLSEDKQNLLRDYLRKEVFKYYASKNERYAAFREKAIKDGMPRGAIYKAFAESELASPKTGSNEWRFDQKLVEKVAKEHNIPAGVAHYELCEIFDNLRAVLTGKIYRVGERRHSWRNITPKERKDKAYWLLHRQFGKNYSNNELVTMMFIDAENGYKIARNVFPAVQYAMEDASNEQIAKALGVNEQTVARALHQAEVAYGWEDERGALSGLLKESDISHMQSREYKEDDKWTPTKGGALFKEVQRLLHKGLSKDAIVKRLVDGKKASEAEAKRIVASADEKVGNGLFDAMGLEFDMGDTRPERDKFADIKKLLNGGASEESVMKKATTDFSLDEKTARKLVDRAKSEIKAHKDLIAEKRRAREKATGVVQPPVLAPSITRKATEEEMADYEAAKKGSEKSTYAKIRENADEAVKRGQSEESFVMQMANTYKGFNRDLIAKAYQQAVKDSTVSDEERAIMREREAGSVGAEARAIQRDTEFHSYVERHGEAWENQIDGFVDPENLSRRAEGKPEINKVNLLRNVHTVATLASHFGEKEPVRWTWEGSKAAYRGIAYGKAEKELKRLGWGTRKINEAIRYWQTFGFPMAKDAAELTKMEQNEAKDRSLRSEPELFKKEVVGSAAGFDFTGMADSAADYLLKSEQAKQKAGKASSLDLFGGMFKSDAEAVRGGTENGIMSANGNRTNTQVRFLDRNRVRADLDSLLSAEGVRRFTDPSGVASWSCPIETAKQAYVKFNSDPEAAKLFNAVYPVAKKLAVEVVFDDRTSITESAHSLNDQVVYHLGNLGLSSRQRAADVILHELIHSVVEYARQPAKYAKFKKGAAVNGTRINDRLVEASNELQKLWRSNFVRLLANGKYAAKDSGELIAELSNRNTREILKKDGVFTRIVKALARLLNVANEWANGGRSDYDKLVGILGKFLDNYDTVLMDEVAAGEYDLKAKSATSGIFTGSAADYNKPSLHAVGTGEGSQVYGWGLYGSNQRGVAEHYANILTSPGYIDPEKIFLDGTSLTDLIKKYRDMQEIEGSPEFDAEEYNRLGRDIGALGLIVEDGHSVRNAIWKYEDDKYRKDHVKRLKEIAGSVSVVGSGNIYEQTFFTNRAPGDESHLLSWYEPVSEENLQRVYDGLDRLTRENFAKGMTDNRYTKELFLEWDNALHGPGKITGERVYDTLQNMLAAVDAEGDVNRFAMFGEIDRSTGHRSSNATKPKAASEFLASADIDGVKYPVDSYGGKTIKDGDKAGWNYVSFRDDNIKVDHKWVNGEQMFKSNAEDIRGGDAELYDLDKSFVKAVADGDAYRAREIIREYANKIMVNPYKSADGKAAVLYHGTENFGAFTVFKTPSFFTDNEHVAATYGEKDYGGGYKGGRSYPRDLTEIRNLESLTDEEVVGEYNREYGSHLRKTDDKDWYEDVFSRNIHINKIRQKLSGVGDGAYRVYVDLGERPLVLDANGGTFQDSVNFTDENDAKRLDSSYTFIDVACRIAPELGYTSVVVRNIKDSYHHAHNDIVATDVIPMSPSQIKSADITYDSDGKLIPLSKRFKKENNDILFKSNSEDIRMANAADASVIFGARASQATHDLAFDKVVVRSGVKDKDLDSMAERKLRDKTEVNRLVERALNHEPLDEVGIRTLILHERDQLAGLYAANEAGRTDEAQAIEESVDRIAMAVQRSLAHTGAMLRQARRGASLDSMRDLKVWLVGEAKRRMAKQGVKGEVPAEMMKRIEEQAKALEGKNKEIAEALKRIAELEDKSRKMANDLEVERKKKAYSPFVASDEAKAAFKSKYEGLGAKVNDRSIDAVNAISSLLGRGRMFAGNPTVELTDEMREAFSQLVYDFGMDFAKAAKGVHDLFDGSADSLFAKFRSEMEKTPSPDGSKKGKTEAVKTVVNRRRESFDKRVPKYEAPTDRKSGLETARKRIAKERASTIQMMDDFAASFDERRRVLGEYLRNFLSSLVATNPTLTTDELLLAMADEANALDTENTYTTDDMMSVNLGEDGFDIADRSTAAQRLTKLRRALEAVKKGSIREASKLSGIGYQSDAEVLDDMRLDLENRIHALANEMTTVIGRPEGEERAKKIAEEIGKLHAEIEELRADKPMKDKLDAWSARHGKRLRTAEERMLATLQRQIDELSRRIRENDFQPKPAKPRTNLAGMTAKVAAKTRERDEMRRKFKTERERYEYRKLNALQRIGRDTFDILGEIKAVAGSLDLSSILRQGGQLTWAHPLLFSKNFVDTLKTFLSEDRAKTIMDEIRSRPNAKFYEKAGIEFTDWGQDAQNADDRFLLNHFRKITKNRLIAKGVEMSERAFSMYLNMMRADVFDRMVASSTYGSADKMTDQQLRAIGNYINIASQRGAIDRSTAFGKAIPMLNTVLWSPRNIASRYQFLWNTAKLVTPGANPYGDKTLRKLFAMETARYLGGVAVAIAFAKMIADLMRGDDEPPEDLVTDPRSSDFLNVKFGNTRVDFLSGLKQIIVFQSRLFTGEKMNSRGEIVPTNIYETLGRFLRTKFSPGMSVVSDFYTGETFDKQDLDWTSVWGKDNETISPYRHVFEQVAPLTLFDVHEQWKQSGVKKSVLTWMLTILGAGVQAYDPYTYKQMSGDYKYFRRLYREAVESGDEAEAKRIIEYHPMLNRMGSIDAAVKRINKMKRDLKKMEEGGYSKESIAQVKDELERDTKLAINLMMNFKNPGQIE